MENLAFGWIGIPIAVWRLFYPYPVIILIILAPIASLNGFPIIARAFGAVAIVGMVFLNIWALASWLANIILFVSWFCVLYCEFQTTFYMSVAAMLFTLSFLSIGDLPLGPKNAVVPVSLGTGYWLWLVASGTIALGSGVVLWRERRLKSALLGPLGGNIRMGIKNER